MFALTFTGRLNNLKHERRSRTGVNMPHKFRQKQTIKGQEDFTLQAIHASILLRVLDKHSDPNGWLDPYPGVRHISAYNQSLFIKSLMAFYVDFIFKWLYQRWKKPTDLITVDGPDSEHSVSVRCRRHSGSFSLLHQ